MRVGVSIAVLGWMMTGCAPPVSLVPVPEDPMGRSAALIINECAPLAASAAMACHEDALMDVLHSDGVAAAMEVAQRMGDLDGEIERQGHVYAHAIGLAAYTTPDEVDDVFSRCTPAYQSGCYHGVIQSYFADVASAGAHAIDADALEQLCAGQRGENGDQWLLFQCVHGVGHGVTMVANHHLPTALEMCDLIEVAWERDACYGGAFMENIVQATHPHHSTGRPQLPTTGGDAQHDHAGAASASSSGGHAHGGHAHGENESPQTDGGDHARTRHADGHRPVIPGDFPALDPDDPLYPCSVLPDRYLVSCYQMQTSAILFHNGGDFADAARVCRTAPDQYQPWCFRSLGRDVSAVTVQNHQRAFEMCERFRDGRHDCQWGYVKNVVDVTADPAAGFEFCAIIPDDEGKRRCYGAVGEQIWVLAADESGKAAMCEAAGPPGEAACRVGAGLPEQAAAADR